jgi:hypothetical protein
MSDPLTVTASEQGVVRVFTTDLEPEGDAAITPSNIEKLLGDGIELDKKKVEVFPAHVIGTLGLPMYLQEGYGIAEEAMAGKSAVLEALSGLVILIPSSAFQGQAVTLDPNGALRFIGAFEEVKATPPSRMTKREATEGDLAPDGPPPDVRHARRMRRSWIAAVGALIAALSIVLFFVF